MRWLGLKSFYFLVQITLSKAVSPVIKLIQCTVGATGKGKCNLSRKARPLRRMGIQVTSEVPREGQGTS